MSIRKLKKEIHKYEHLTYQEWVLEVGRYNTGRGTHYYHRFRHVNLAKALVEQERSAKNEDYSWAQTQLSIKYGGRK